MNRKLGFILLAATVAVATAAAWYQGPAAASLPAAAGLSAAPTGQDTSRAQLRRLMAEKVHRAEIILGGLAQGDLNKVQHAADELVQIAAQANWSVAPRAREAALNEAEFQKRAALLAKFARDGDLHASYYQFVQVVFQCFDCHEELRPPRR